MFGFLNVYKPKGKTSHDVVSILRSITKIKQIGHTGTLDPFAEGVLPICIGKATRLIEYLDDDKAYVGTIKFGGSTTTFDIEGEIVKTSESKVEKNDVENALKFFKGEIQQLPPIFSAIKIQGKKLYEYARAGEEVEIKPRKVVINKIKLINFDLANQTAEIYIECSKGTYIRSIANDLGEKLGCYGHLVKLVRTKAGQFEIDKAVRLEDLKNFEDTKNHLIYPLDYLNYSQIEVDECQKNDVSHGKPLNILSKNGIVVLTYKNQLIAVAEILNNIAKMKKVFI